jgi:putative glutamine amidotransferase
VRERGKEMKPMIGINMDYVEYSDYHPEDKRFRDYYKMYTAYVDAVQRYGGASLLIPPFQDLRSLDLYVQTAQGFIFSGGDDYPPELYGEEKHPETTLVHKRRSASDIYLAREVMKTDKPILAICGGIQLINIVCGGKLIQHIENLEMHNKKSKTQDRTHSIRIQRDSSLYRIFGTEEIIVNSAHHQVIDPSHVGKGLRVTSRAPDGVIESLELENSGGRFFLAVQWHPERVDDESQRELIFKAFIDSIKTFPY